MKLAVQIPMKAKSSTRVPNKNFRDLNGKPLCYWVLEELVKLPQEIDLFIDSEGGEVFKKLSSSGFDRYKFHKRSDWYSEDHANGNHLIHQFAVNYPNYDAYAQIFVTAVTLKHDVILDAFQTFTQNLASNDSLFLATRETGWVWFDQKPVNYDPSSPRGLPRSQDACFFKETTGLYLITRDALLKTGCRIGLFPLPKIIDPEYALDIDTMNDFHEAEKLLSNQNL